MKKTTSSYNVSFSSESHGQSDFFNRTKGIWWTKTLVKLIKVFGFNAADSCFPVQSFRIRVRYQSKLNDGGKNYKYCLLKSIVNDSQSKKKTPFTSILYVWW